MIALPYSATCLTCRTRMSDCPSFLPGQGKGRGDAEDDLSEVDDSLKFILFFFTVKNLGHRGPQVRSRSLRSGCPPDFQAVGGVGRPLFCPVFLWLYKVLKINKLQEGKIPGKITIYSLLKYPS